MTLLSRAREFFSRKSPKKELDDNGAVIEDQSIWEQFRRIGGALTPSDVSRILREADCGDTTALCDLANEMRQKDGHLQSVLQTREQALLGLNWELYYEGQDPKSSRGSRQLNFVAAALNACAGFQRMIAHHTSAIYFGFAVSEIIWTRVGDRLVIKKLVNVAPRRFRFRTADGQLVWQDDTMGHGVDFQTDYPEKFIVSQPRVNGDVPHREGLARVLMWPALFRNWTLSDWLKLAELAWKPWRLGEFKKTASSEDIAALKSIVAGMSASGAAVHPETVKVTLQMPTSTGGSSKSDHSSLFEAMGREMSKATLGQTLTTEQGSVGSQALGSVHNDIRGDILEGDAQWLAEVITEQLIRPLIVLNYGPTAPVPSFRFITTEAADMSTFADGIEKLAKVLKIPAAWVRDQIGMPEPRPDDELVGAWDVDLSGMDEPDAKNTNDNQEDEAA